MTEQPMIHQFDHRSTAGKELGTASIAPRILIADDDPNIRQLLVLLFHTHGFDVVSVADGLELIQQAQRCHPQLILVDIGMPRMDGFDAIRWIRSNTRTAHIPIMILTARSSVKDVVIGFETGADDYLVKPFDAKELLARARSHLRRSAQRPVLSPLTGLPGGMLLSQELQHRIDAQQPLALLYADLDNFKAFNDTYGFSRGDHAILLLAEILRSTSATYGGRGDFLGHIGGDDFALLTASAQIERICQTLIAQFDQVVGTLYDEEDRQRGYITGTDRYGIIRRFGLMSISIGVVTNQHCTFRDEESLTRIAAEMKHYAKEQPGSSYAIDQRGFANELQPTRRLAAQQQVYIIGPDRTLHALVRTALVEHGYIVVAAPSLAEAGFAGQPKVVIIDSQVGAQLEESLAELAACAAPPAVIVLAHNNPERVLLPPIAVTWLHLPLPLGEIVACVDRLT